MLSKISEIWGTEQISSAALHLNWQFFNIIDKTSASYYRDLHMTLTYLLPQPDNSMVTQTSAFRQK